MFTLSVLLFACSGDSESTNATPVTGEIQSPEGTNNPKGAAQSKAGEQSAGTQNLETTETGVRVRLPALNAKSGVTKYCFFQSMSASESGMTGLSFETSKDVQFVRLQGVSSQTVTANVNQWLDCAKIDGGVSTQSIYEMVGIDLDKATPETLFNGFEWFSLPQQMAFAFPGTDLWFYEVQLSGSSDLENVSVVTNVSTKPKNEIERWAGVMDIAMEGSSSSVFETGCSLPQDIEVLSVFGHSEPTKGTWRVQCGEEEMFAVESSLFAKDTPPLKNFEQPKGVTAGTKCTLSCDWDGDEGQICIASLVASPIESPIRCVDNQLIQQ